MVRRQGGEHITGMHGWSAPTAVCLFSDDGLVPKAAGTQERAHTAALSYYWSQVPQLSPMGNICCGQQMLSPSSILVC